MFGGRVLWIPIFGFLIRHDDDAALQLYLFLFMSVYDYLGLTIGIL